MAMRIDLNSDLGESFGPWAMGDDARMLGLVTSANIACGGHAGDPDTMYKTLVLARDQGVCVGAHPGYADREGFGRRIIPMQTEQVSRLIAAQVGALCALAQLAGTRVHYVKPHGALANLAADDLPVAQAIVKAVSQLQPQLAILAISGTHLELVAREAGIPVYSEIFADRAYLPNGRLVPRSQAGAVLHDPEIAVQRLLGFIKTGKMPVIGGEPIALEAHSICVHGDNPEAVAMATVIRQRLVAEGVELKTFL
jgi:5-oxoprolinase (ATP-hydrolysing) subunit A